MTLTEWFQVCRPLRGLMNNLLEHLGFRFTPPQALCFRALCALADQASSDP